MSKSLQRDKSPGSEGGGQDQTKREQFGNPITKTTFEALPRIYGVRKKKKYTFKYESKPKQKTQQTKPQAPATQPVPSLSKPMLTQKMGPLDIDKTEAGPRRFKTEMKKYDKKYTEQLSQPRGQFCNKRYCFCNKQHRQQISKSQSKVNMKKRPSKLLSLHLHEAAKATEPDDIESRHKVSMNFTNINEGLSERSHLTLLEFLRNNKAQPIHQSTRSKLIRSIVEEEPEEAGSRDVKLQYPERTHTVSVQTELDENQTNQQQQDGKVKGNSEKIERYFPKATKRKIASSSSLRPEVNDLQPKNQKDDIDKEKVQSNLPLGHPRLKLEQMRIRYKQLLQEDSEEDDNKSVASSVSSASISKHVFNSDNKVNTMFHTLNKKASSNNGSSIDKRAESRLKSQSEPQKKEKPLFQKKSGLFVIPEEDEYVDYLKNYKPINENFTIKKLIRKQNFKVVPEEEGVFFGQMIDSKKNGKGLMVTERSVFQGDYKNDLKTFGCERNIDGVYKGQFVNGIREGYGTFQWYNGEVFEGEWKNGTKNGYGVWKSPRGDFYEGNWLLNRQHGKGIYKHRLSTYRGQFSQFLKHGEGQQIFSNGDKYQGSYKKGKPHGRGKYSWADGSVYEGDFLNGVREGKGKWVLNNGTVYEGEFKNDFKDGFGRQSYSSGERYQGIFKEGNKYEGTLFDQHNNTIRITPTQ